MQIQQMMTKDVTSCRPDESLAEAARIMWDRDCGCVPVVDENHQLSGIITDRDICMAAYTQGQPLARIPVHSVVSREVSSCRADADVKDAEALMQKWQIRRLPIVDQGDHPTTRGDTRTIAPRYPINRRDNGSVRCAASRHPLTRSASCTSTVSFRTCFA